MAVVTGIVRLFYMLISFLVIILVVVLSLIGRLGKAVEFTATELATDVIRVTDRYFEKAGI